MPSLPSKARACSAPCPQPNTTCSIAFCRDGECVTQNAPKYQPCNDGDACSLNDICDGNGACTGTKSVVCIGTPCLTASCNSATGCQYTPVADNTPCPSDQCVASSVCRSGVCTPSAYKTNFMICNDSTGAPKPGFSCFNGSCAQLGGQGACGKQPGAVGNTWQNITWDNSTGAVGVLHDSVWFGTSALTYAGQSVFPPLSFFQGMVTTGEMWYYNSTGNFWSNPITQPTGLTFQFGGHGCTAPNGVIWVIMWDSSMVPSLVSFTPGGAFGGPFSVTADQFAQTSCGADGNVYWISGGNLNMFNPSSSAATVVTSQPRRGSNTPATSNPVDPRLVFEKCTGTLIGAAYYNTSAYTNNTVFDTVQPFPYLAGDTGFPLQITVYDPALAVDAVDRYIFGSPLPEGGPGRAFCTDNRGFIYAPGQAGWNRPINFDAHPIPSTKSMWQYNIVEDTWTMLAPLPVNHACGACMVTADGWLLFKAASDPTNCPGAFNDGTGNPEIPTNGNTVWGLQLF